MGWCVCCALVLMWRGRRWPDTCAVVQMSATPDMPSPHPPIHPPRPQVPFSYCWSTSVVPKPRDWPRFASVTGYLFLEESKLSDYQPPAGGCSAVQRLLPA